MDTKTRTATAAARKFYARILDLDYALASRLSVRIAGRDVVVTTCHKDVLYQIYALALRAPFEHVRDTDHSVTVSF